MYFQFATVSLSWRPLKNKSIIINAATLTLKLYGYSIQLNATLFTPVRANVCSSLPPPSLTDTHTI